MQSKAVRFLRDVVGEPDRADEFDAMSPEEYAEHKRVEIKNPVTGSARTHQRRIKMARPNYAELKERIAELEEENQALNDKLDSITDIVSEDDEEDPEDHEELD